ncbi:hypothetical protein GCM10025868_18120 [Angustibacter aerolatus]|uniref:Uncharacterized protein n=1 Tax=Angustibacter aerolatus TaxID=1162965 RepID=A0ABQ6JED3_9ACTN|nr:hypothetical protein GCM10025868_18120 [Angustibacter aerolatus]
MFLAVPGAKQAWPNVAACWSPRMPAMGTPPSTPRSRTVPYTSDDDAIRGSIDVGTPISAAIPSSQSSVSRSISSVREAFVTSVTCSPPSTPPVMFHTSQLSIVPISRSPASARSRAPSTWSSTQRTLGAAKYVASGRPVVAFQRSGPTSPPSLAAQPVGAGVLPDDRVVHGLAGGAVPHDRRLALVRDAHGGDLAGRHVGGRQRVRHHLAGARPDLRRVVLDPAGAGQDLAVLLLRDGGHRAVVVEQDAARAGGPLVDGGDVGHGRRSTA